jgi:hypothetical protein
VAGLVGRLAPGDLDGGRAFGAGGMNERRRRTGPLLPSRQDLTRECRGCGVMAELVQGSDYCWDCTYPEPLCLCAGASWRNR